MPDPRLLARTTFGAPDGGSTLPRELVESVAEPADVAHIAQHGWPVYQSAPQLQLPPPGVQSRPAASPLNGTTVERSWPRWAGGFDVWDGSSAELDPAASTPLDAMEAPPVLRRNTWRGSPDPWDGELVDAQPAGGIPDVEC